jgi:DUF4097 and DUF4098 domain-containing protein YvlB
MKLMLALTGIILTVCPIAVAQDSGSRIVVPARNSSRPRKVDVNLMQGSVTVKVHSGRDVIIESGSERIERQPRESGGMRRIDVPNRGLSVEEEDNVITVRTRTPSNSSLVISVPADTSVTARSHNGDIEVDGLRGEFDVQTHNGKITLNGVSGTVVAHTANGTIKVVMDRVEASKPLSFSSLNGSIDVTLPADVKANLKLNSFRGEIWSDFDIKLGGGATTQPNNTPDGKFRVTMDRNLGGTINGGGADLSFHTLNGRITIRKK